MSKRASVCRREKEREREWKKLIKRIANYFDLIFQFILRRYRDADDATAAAIRSRLEKFQLNFFDFDTFPRRIFVANELHIEVFRFKDVR